MQRPVLAAGTPLEVHVPVQIGPRFLELFSDQLYRSPNKAFEELVSNGWDAGAQSIRVGTSKDLGAETACMWVLDDGASMDERGLRELWQVASSPKARPGYEAPGGRPPIGKFGIGKLATYALAHQLTYVCRAADGIIRAVSLDFRVIGEQDATKLHIEEIPLTVRTLDLAQLEAVLEDLGDPRLGELLPDGPLALEGAEDPLADEFGGGAPAAVTPSGTWTLVALTALKPKGRELRRGVVKRMLRAALPLGAGVRIAFDSDEPLEPLKLETQRMVDWTLGQPGFDLDEIPLAEPEPGGPFDDVDDRANGDATIPAEGDEQPDDDAPRTLRVERYTSPYPYMTLEGFPGRITGHVVIFEESIATKGTKSEQRAPSNGFHVNVRGRVVNEHDNAFGLPALSHTVWSKLRVTIRADGLHDHLAVSREGVFEGEHADAFRALLRSIFNAARIEHDATVRARWPNVHEVLVGEYGTMPLTPLIGLVKRSLSGELSTGGLIGMGDIADREQAGRDFAAEVEAEPGKALDDVVLDYGDPIEERVHYDFDARQVVVNASHPFVVEFGRTRDQQELLQKVGLVELLADAYLMQELDLEPGQVADLRHYRDELERLLARKQRRSAALLAQILMAATSHAKALEIALADSIEALGFGVMRQAQSGKPEGIATATLHPDGEGARRSYRISYEAKSSRSTPQKVSTVNFHASGQKRHRVHAAADTDVQEHEVEYALVVGPAYAEGALEWECDDAGVCPMYASTLARLLMATVTTGPLDLDAFRRVLDCTDPKKVDAAATDVIAGAEQRTHVTMPEVLDAIDAIDDVDSLHCNSIAMNIRQARGGSAQHPDAGDIARMLSGLSLLVPEALFVNGREVKLGAAPGRVADAIRERISPAPLRPTLAGLERIVGPLSDAQDDSN